MLQLLEHKAINWNMLQLKRAWIFFYFGEYMVGMVWTILYDRTVGIVTNDGYSGTYFWYN